MRRGRDGFAGKSRFGEGGNHTICINRRAQKSSVVSATSRVDGFEWPSARPDQFT
jgi:hypothetical protein